MWKSFGRDEIASCGEFLACRNPISRVYACDEQVVIDGQVKFTWSFEDSLRERHSGEQPLHNDPRQKQRRDPPLARRQHRIRIPDPPQLVLGDAMYYTFPVATVDTTKSEWWDVDAGDEERESIKVWTESFGLGSSTAADQESEIRTRTERTAGTQCKPGIARKGIEPKASIEPTVSIKQIAAIEPIPGTESRTGLYDGDAVTDNTICVETRTRLGSMPKGGDGEVSGSKESIDRSIDSKINRPDSNQLSDNSVEVNKSKEICQKTASSQSIQSKSHHSFAHVEDLECQLIDGKGTLWNLNEMNRSMQGNVRGENFEEIRAGIASITSNLTKTHPFYELGSRNIKRAVSAVSQQSEWREQAPDYANESEYSLGPGKLIQTELVLDTLESIIQAPQIPEPQEEYLLKKMALEPPGSIRPSRSMSVETLRLKNRSMPTSPLGAIDLAHVLVRSPASVQRIENSRKTTSSTTKSKDWSEDFRIPEDRPFIRRDILPSPRTPTFYRPRTKLNLPKRGSISACANAGLSVGGASDAATTDAWCHSTISPTRYRLRNRHDETDDDGDTNCTQLGETHVNRTHRRSGSNESLGTIGRNIGTIFVVNDRSSAAVTRVRR